MQPLAWKRQIKFRTHLIQGRRAPKIVQYTDGQEQVIEQRTSFLLPLLTPPKTLRACVGPSSAMPKTNCKGGDVVGECYNDWRCYDYLVSCSVCSCGLDEPVIWQRTVLTYFRCVRRLYVDYAMFPSRSIMVHVHVDLKHLTCTPPRKRDRYQREHLRARDGRFLTRAMFLQRFAATYELHCNNRYNITSPSTAG